MANIDASNQSYVTLINNMSTFFNGGNWNYMYDRVAGSKSYLLNPSNATGLLYSYTANGNPASVSNYAGVLLWFYTAYYANLYPLPDDTQASCAAINTAILGLQGEIAASDKVFVNDGIGETHNARTLAINNLNSQFNSLYANLSCDTYLANQAAAQEAAANTAAQTSATQSEIAAYTATQGTTVLGIPITTANIGIAAAVVVVGILIFAYLKKSKES